jgi:hypothetical protein
MMNQKEELGKHSSPCVYKGADARVSVSTRRNQTERIQSGSPATHVSAAGSHPMGRNPSSQQQKKEEGGEREGAKTGRGRRV